MLPQLLVYLLKMYCEGQYKRQGQHHSVGVIAQKEEEKKKLWRSKGGHQPRKNKAEMKRKQGSFDCKNDFSHSCISHNGSHSV